MKITLALCLFLIASTVNADVVYVSGPGWGIRLDGCQTGYIDGVLLTAECANEKHLPVAPTNETGFLIHFSALAPNFSYDGQCRLTSYAPPSYSVWCDEIFADGFEDIIG